MKVLRNSAAIAILTTLILALFGLAAGGTAAASAADVKTAEVKYSAVPAGEYHLDQAHSIIGFAVRHLEINWVEGRFKDFDGTINYNDQDVTRSTVRFTAKIESIDTGVEQRNAHLRTADFFDAAKYPEMKFTSTKIEKKGKGKYILYGDLTIKGVTRPVSFPFTFTGAIEDPWGGTRFGINAETIINRRDYNINYGNAMPIGGFDVGNNVTVKLQLEAAKSGK